MYQIREVSMGPRFEPGGVIAVGWYDGVHRGHRSLLDQLRRVADERGVRTGLVILDDDRDTRRLTSLDQRLELIAQTGQVDTVWVVTADDVSVVSLEDAHQEWNDPDRTCSSAEITALIDAGDVAGAANLLGRFHEMRGVVELGDQRGRTIGFPTANVAMPESLVIPAEAVYAGLFTAADGVTRPAAISLGRRPTFYPDGLALLEAHVIDFDGDLYGQRVSIHFVDKIRDQRRFDGLDDLGAQLHDDVETARSMLADLAP